MNVKLISYNEQISISLFSLSCVLTAQQGALCVVCELAGSISQQLYCTSCGQHYHGNCLDPPVQVNPIVRAGWQCPECKICQTCRLVGFVPFFRLTIMLIT